MQQLAEEKKAAGPELSVCLDPSEKKMVAECHGGGAAAAGGDFLIKLFGMTIPVPECGDAKVGRFYT